MKDIDKIRLMLFEYAADHSLDELMTLALDEVSALVDSPIGFYHILEPDQKTLSLQQWSTRTLEEFCTAEGLGKHYPVDQAGVWVDCVYQRKPVIHNDYAALPHKRGMPEGHAEVIRELVVPVMRGGKVVAVFGVGNKPTDYTEQDVETVSLLADITWVVLNQKRSEEALRESQAFLENIFEAIQDGVSVLDRDLNVIKTNRWMEKQYRERMPLQGQKCYRVYQQRSSECPWCPALRSLETGEKQSAIVPYPSEKDPRGWIEITVFPIKDQTGQVVNLIEYARDITDRMSTELALKKEHDRARSYLEIAGVMIVALDREANVLLINQKGCEILGRPQEEIVGRNWFESFLPERMRGQVGDVFNRLMDGEIELVEYFENSVLTRDGEERIIAWHNALLQDETGWIIGTLSSGEDITARREAEAQLHSEKEFTDTALDTQRDTFFLFEPVTGKALRWNRAFSDITGYTDEEIADLPAPGSYYSAEDLERATPFLERVFEVGSGTIELDLICKDGRKVPTEYQVSVIRDDTGNARYLISIGRDVSERKKSENALRESERRYRQVVDTMLDGLAIIGKDGTIKFVNSTLCRIYGYSREELIGMNAGQMVHPDFHPVFHQFLADLEETGRFHGETIDVRKDGTTLHTDVRGAQIRFAGEECFLAVIRDVSDRKQAEEALRTASELNERILASSPIAIVIYDSVGDCVMANQAAADIVGATVEQVHQQNLHRIESWKETGVYDMVLSAIEDGERKHLQREITTTFGRQAYFDLHCIPITVGDQPYFLLMYDDITERKQAQTEQDKLQAQLQQAQKMEAVGRLAGGVAHDFNNLLGVIMGRTEMILMDIKEGDPHFHDLEEILKASGRSAALTSQLLAFARRQNIAPKVLDLNDTVEWMLKMLRRLIGEDIDLVWEPDSNLWPIRMDPAQVDQILANLSVNARDAITGNGKVTIETANESFDEDYPAHHRGYRPGEFVMLAVSDDGCGMDQEIQSHLFEPFFTTKEIGKGTGLGLATVFGIVKQNDGFINVYSEPGKGTTFKIYIPRYVGATGEPAEVCPAIVPQSQGETILLVEDEPGILAMGHEMLERLGYMVLAASDPNDALRLISDHTGEIDLLMTDVVMPGSSGRDLSEKVAMIRPDIKTLYISGYTANVIAHHGVLDEGVNFLPKPFSLMALGIKLRQVLDELPSG